MRMVGLSSSMEKIGARAARQWAGLVLVQTTETRGCGSNTNDIPQVKQIVCTYNNLNTRFIELDRYTR